VSWKIREEVRPVSLMSVLDKGVETTIKGNLYLGKHDIVGENYMPFLKGRLCLSNQEIKNHWSRIVWYSL